MRDEGVIGFILGEMAICWLINVCIEKCEKYGYVLAFYYHVSDEFLSKPRVFLFLFFELAFWQLTTHDSTITSTHLSNVYGFLNISGPITLDAYPNRRTHRSSSPFPPIGSAPPTLNQINSVNLPLDFLVLEVVKD